MSRRHPAAAAATAVLVLLLIAGGFAAIVWGPGALPHENSAQRSAELARNRTAILAVLAGAIAVASAYFTWLGHGLARRGQISDRFFKAVEHLDEEDKGYLRLGAVHALRAIARDSRPDRPAVLNVLEAYVDRAGAPTGEGRPDVDAAVEVIQLLGGTVPPHYRPDVPPPTADALRLRALQGLIVLILRWATWAVVPIAAGILLGIIDLDEPVWRAITVAIVALAGVPVQGQLNRLIRGIWREAEAPRFILTDTDEAIRDLRAELDQLDRQTADLAKQFVNAIDEDDRESLRATLDAIEDHRAVVHEKLVDIEADRALTAEQPANPKRRPAGWERPSEGPSAPGTDA